MSNELAVREAVTGGGLLTKEGIDQTVQQLDMLKTMVERVLRPDEDYGIIPGTKNRTLLKPGADNVQAAFLLYPQSSVLDKTLDLDRGYLSYVVKVQLVSHNDGQIKSEGIGECNSYEEKYRYRKADRKCPKCGSPTILKSKFPDRDSGDVGWYCYGKKGGCGANFRSDDKAITDQVTGKTLNPDPFGLANTILKMAEKRASVDATMKLPGVARFFTQDIGDIGTNESGAEAPAEDKRRDDFDNLPQHQEGQKPLGEKDIVTEFWKEAKVKFPSDAACQKYLGEHFNSKLFGQLSPGEKKAALDLVKAMPVLPK